MDDAIPTRPLPESHVLAQFALLRLFPFDPTIVRSNTLQRWHFTLGGTLRYKSLFKRLFLFLGDQSHANPPDVLGEHWW
jgi:hypothetical protein